MVTLRITIMERKLAFAPASRDNACSSIPNWADLNRTQVIIADFGIYFLALLYNLAHWNYIKFYLVTSRKTLSRTTLEAL